MDSRLEVGVVGAGPVGLALAKAISDAGHKLIGIATTDPVRIDNANSLLPGVRVGDVASVVSGVDLAIFAIPGSQIPVLVTGLVETNTLMPGQLLVSTSPDFGYEVFAPAFSLGVVPMALHPAIKFTGFSAIDRARLQESYIAVDAPKQVLPIVQTLAIELGGEPIYVPAEARANYSEAVSVASTFTSLITAQAINLLNEVGIEKSRNILSSLMRTSLEESLRNAVTEIDPADLLDGDVE